MENRRPLEKSSEGTFQVLDIEDVSWQNSEKDKNKKI